MEMNIIHWILYDGTFDGILTIIFDCYLENQIPIGITSKEDYIPNLFDTTTCIITDFEKSKRISTDSVR